MKLRNIFEFRHFMVLIACAIIASCSSSENNTEEPESQALYRIQVGGKCGFINEKGQLVIEPQFDRAYWEFTDSVCYAELGDRKGLVNTKGEYVVELDKSIDWVRFFRNGVAEFYTINGKWGVINKKGEIILPAEYKTVQYDGGIGFVVTDDNDNMGYVDNDGQFIVPCRYDAVNGFSEGLMVVATSDKVGYVDTLGNWAIDTIFDDARAFGDGLARVKKDGEWMFIDHNGNAVERLDFDEILTGFACNRAFAKQGQNIVLIDKTGDVITEIDAESVYGFSEGYATFKKKGKFGKVDTMGVVVVPAKYESLSDTDGGMSVFVKNGKRGCIDTVGNVVIEPIHENVEFRENRLLVSGADDDYHLGTWYDLKGNLIWKDMTNSYKLPKKPTKNDYIAYFDSRMADLDPIEGLYYVTYQPIRENMETGHVTPAGGTTAEWYAVCNMTEDEYVASCVTKSGYSWLKKFVKLRESNVYAITNIDTSNRYADDYTLTLENPNEFEVLLRLNGNGSYNWYDQYKFIKEFPSSEAFEQVQKAEWSGTGFAIADGYIATNNHVVSGAKHINVKGINGDIKKAYKGFVVANDREHDLAIIKIVDKNFDCFEEIPYSIGKTLPEVGDEVFALGYPLTNTMGKEVKVTDGIISAASGYKGDQAMYQISAPLQPGNSGGPLFDKNGNVIGVVCAKHTDAENANYAVKVSYLYSLVTNSNIGIKMSDKNKVGSKSLSKQVKQVKPFVYLIECNSR